MKHTRQIKEKNFCGPLIRAARVKCKPPVSQEDLAGRLAALGITLDQGAISRVENQSRYLMDYELMAIAEALKIPPALLFPKS